MKKSTNEKHVPNRFTLVNADTDSISFCKTDGAPFSEFERQSLLEDLNSQFPERIKFEDDGYYPVVVVVKAKNYVMFDGKTMKYKGSALKATTKEPALKEFITDVMQEIFEASAAADHEIKLRSIYDRYAKEILKVKDIKRWATRKTITDKVLNGTRTNETKVKDAIVASEYVEGDRAYFYFKEDNSLSLAEKFDGSYNKIKLLEKLFSTAKIFSTILDVKTLFPNYKLKRNKSLLEQLAQ